MNESAGGEDLSKSERRQKIPEFSKAINLEKWFPIAYEFCLFPYFSLEKSIFASLYLFAAALGNLFSQVYGS